MYIRLRTGSILELINNKIKEIEALGYKVENLCIGPDRFLKLECNENDIYKIVEILDELYVGFSRYKYTASFNNYKEISINGYKFNKDNFTIIGGPCSVESEEQMNTIFNEIKDNIHIFRGGAFKPRTSPYEFQGMKIQGIELLKNTAKNKPIISEIVSTEQLNYFVDRVDIIQVGARNMQNFELLKHIGKTNKPVLLKRGLANTIHEWICAAEYIIEQGNKNVILCERGIRTFEDYTRNTLDLSAVVAAKELTCLPVIVDPSHACGKWWMIEKLSKAAMAAGADGLIIEVHHDPKNALSDGPQSLKPEGFNRLVEDLKVLAPLFNKKVV